jgi:hypothetical protein
MLPLFAVMPSCGEFPRQNESEGFGMSEQEWPPNSRSDRVNGSSSFVWALEIPASIAGWLRSRRRSA